MLKGLRLLYKRNTEHKKGGAEPERRSADMTEFDFFSSKGAGSIHAYRWEPAGSPSPVLQIIHGIAEHAARYDEMARFFTQRGVLVTAEDHMGHGRSSGTDAPLCFSGGWTAAVDDSYALLERTHREFPDVPYLLFGHSMGSFLTRTLLYRYPNAPLRAVILCGTAWEPWPVLTAGRAPARWRKKRLGATGYSPLLNALMFGLYNRKFPRRADAGRLDLRPARGRRRLFRRPALRRAGHGRPERRYAARHPHESEAAQSRGHAEGAAGAFHRREERPVGSMGKGVQRRPTPSAEPGCSTSR